MNLLPSLKSSRLLLLSLCAAVALCSCSSHKAHEPTKLSRIDETVTVRKLWSTGVGHSLTGMTVVVLAERGVYAAGGKSVFLLDSKDGHRIWETSADSEITAGPGTDGRLVAVGTAAGELEVFDERGKRLWKVRLTGEVNVPPLVGSGFVVARTADTRITAFDAVTGERRWRYQAQVPALTLRAPAAMVFAPAGILVGQANGKLLALNARGETVFDAVIGQAKGVTEVERLIDVVGTPMVDQRMMCAATFQGSLVCMSSRNGELLWVKPVNAVSGPVSDGRRVYVITAIGEIQAFDYGSGEPLWTNSDLRWRSPSAVVPFAGMVALGDYDGVVHFLDAGTGRIVGRTSLSGAVRVPPISLGDRLIFVTEKGEVACLTAAPRD